ncbi:putative bifunctional diguanylate cyclase/phosphodiesterase [Paeniglutamicibacter gangotriensis]
MPNSGPSMPDEPRIPQIVDAILRIADMDFDTVLHPSNKRDEIDAIIMGINAMASELETTYSTLDCRVAERTRQLEAAHDQMALLAYTDPLTQLANRSALMSEIEKSLAASRAGDPAPILLLLDLDAFKSINDTYGHAVGDKVLCQLADRLRSCVRTEDIVARLGGDEFAVLVRLPEYSATTVGRRIVEAMNTDMVVENIHLTPGASLGIAKATESHSPDSLVLEADTAMYVAKRSSVEKVVEFEPFMLFERREKADMLADLRQALGAGQFFPAYQAVICLEDESIIGAEALVRWQRTGHGLVRPDQFLPTAEESGMIGELTEYLLDRVLEDVKMWRTAGLVTNAFKVHLNVTSRELHDLRFADAVLAALRHHDLPASVLCLEITENRLMSGDNLHRYTLLALQKMGVEVFIDDFGTGYSSISYLRQLPVAGAKIDKSLVDGIAGDSTQESFLRAISDLIAACNLKCIVEGVETAGQSAKLKAMGFTTVQGFYYAHPVDSAGFSELLIQGL